MVFPSWWLSEKAFVYSAAHACLLVIVLGGFGHFQCRSAVCLSKHSYSCRLARYTPLEYDHIRSCLLYHTQLSRPLVLTRGANLDPVGGKPGNDSSV